MTIVLIYTFYFEVISVVKLQKCGTERILSATKFVYYTEEETEAPEALVALLGPQKCLVRTHQQISSFPVSQGKK